MQDFGCAREDQLKNLFYNININFKDLLSNACISKKNNIYIHNTSTFDESTIIALDILYKFKGRYKFFRKKQFPVKISFLNKENELYYIIVADENNKKGIIKLINSNEYDLTSANKLILAFPDDSDLNNINTDSPFLYCTYPGLEIKNV